MGIDGRQGGRDAIALARLLLAPTGSMTLVHVRAGGRFPPSDDDLAREAALDSAERAQSESPLERERDATSVHAQLADVVASSVGRGLHELAERRGADLLVVGSSHRGLLGRILVGDDTRASLNGATCAVAVAPRAYGHAASRLATIGVGCDGSAESGAALALALELARAHRATVRALDVVLLPTWLTSGFVGLAAAEVLEADLVARKGEMSALEGVKGEAVLGSPSEELGALGREVDLLMVGPRRRARTLRRLVHGSTSNFLAAHARSPLLVLPRGAVWPTANAADQRQQDLRASRRARTTGVRRDGAAEAAARGAMRRYFGREERKRHEQRR